MHDRRLVRLARQNLNLLVIFDALMTYRHLSQTARVLCISQPAVSHALKKLRDHYSDELFIKRAGGMHPTPFAESIADSIQHALSQLDLSLFEPTDFDFVNSTRRFRLGVNDYSSQILLPKLMGHLQKVAPEIRLQVVHCPLSDKDDVNDRLIAADLDLAVAVFDRTPVVEQNCFLYEDPLVVVMDRQHPLYSKTMTVEAFAGYPQIAVSMRETEPLLINALLASLGLERKVYLTTPYVATLPQIIRGSQLMAVVPHKAAELMMDQPWMGSRAFPLKLQPFSVNLVWSKNRSADAGLAWLIEQVKALEAAS